MNTCVPRNKVKWLCTTGLVALVAAGFSMQAAAQTFHEVAVGAQCDSPSKVGDEVSCSARFQNMDEFGDTHRITEFWGVIDPEGLNIRFPESGNAPITNKSAGTVCTAAPVSDDAPLGWVFPCDVPSDGDNLTPADFVSIGGTFEVPEVPVTTDDAKLNVQAKLLETDLCDDPDTSGCSSIENEEEQPAAINLFEASLDVTKTGPNTAKVGDVVTYTIGFEDTSIGTEFPGFENCTGTDTVLGPLGAFEPGVPRNFDYTVTAGDPNPLANEATITCDVVGFENQVSDSDDHSLEWVNPDITVTKTGPSFAKVGDEVCYDIGFTNTGTGDVENCTGTDTVLGGLGSFSDGVTREFCRTVAETDTDPLENTATITCDIVGFENQEEDSASHSVDLLDPDIDVTKTGPAEAKVGDEITYTIGFTSIGDGDVEDCTGTDTLLGTLGSFESGVTRDFLYTIQEGDPNPLPNTATITCSGVELDNEVSESARHSVDLILPDVSISKDCRPDPVLVGDDITWAITVENTGNVALNCNLLDPDAEIDESFSLDSGSSESFNNSRTVLSGDFPEISNTADVTCWVGDDLDNAVSDSASDTCAVEEPGEEICRTPGFWGTHAGTEKRRSSDLAQTVIDAAGGSLSVCGQTIDNTNVGNVHSAVEAMCVRIEGEQQRQLARQLTAMSLNCIVSGGNADCSGTSVEGLFADANASCTADDGQVNFWIERVDCFNNGGQFDEVAGECVIDDLDPNNCQNRELDESTDIFDLIRPLPGPAGSSGACREANGNGIKVVPAS